MGHKHYLKSLGSDGRARLRFRFDTLQGRVVDFLVQLETRFNDKWLPVVRYDSAHGFPHRDVMNLKGEEQKTLLKLETLEQCLQYAEQDLLDRFEWYLERFLKH